MDLHALIAAALAQRQHDHTLRTIAPRDSANAGLVDFGSNCYLGLQSHPRLITAAKDAMNRYGVGSGASALLGGWTSLHESAAVALSQWKGSEAAILLPSGYQANLAAIQTLLAIDAARPGPRLRFLLDKLVHASVIDAIRHAGAAFRIFPHNGMDKLRRLLVERDPDTLDVVVTESIFSMDGDAADLPALAQLKADHPFVLMLDEAHGSGVYGANGAGYAHEAGFAWLPDISIVTLSKALGSAGGVICASQRFIAAVANFGRALIFSTSVTAIIPATAIAALAVMRDEPHRQQRLRALSRHARQRLADAGLPIPPGDSPIIPVIVGKPEVAIAISASLRDAGFIVPAVRPPTVAPNGSRLRLSLSFEHSDADVKRLLERLITLCQGAVATGG